MKCPHCGVWTTVLETRGVRRRRECGNGHRFTTQEIEVAELIERATRPNKPSATLKVEDTLL